MDTEPLSAPMQIVLDGVLFTWKRSSYDHSTTPAIRYVTYLCGTCVHELKMPLVDHRTLLADHAFTHTRAASDAPAQA